jgi:hypothetical protein
MVMIIFGYYSNIFMERLRKPRNKSREPAVRLTVRPGIAHV